MSPAHYLGMVTFHGVLDLMGALPTRHDVQWLWGIGTAWPLAIEEPEHRPAWARAGARHHKICKFM